MTIHQKINLKSHYSNTFRLPLIQNHYRTAGCYDSGKKIPACNATIKGYSSLHRNHKLYR